MMVTMSVVGSCWPLKCGDIGRYSTQNRYLKCSEHRGFHFSMKYNRKMGTTVCAGAIDSCDEDGQKGMLHRSTMLRSICTSFLISSAVADIGSGLIFTPPVNANSVYTSSTGVESDVAIVLDETKTMSQVVLNTLSDCELAVSIYPTFSYNAGGGGGVGSATRGSDGMIHVDFDTSTLKIPSVSTSTSSILGVPLPPPLNIEIIPQKLDGTINPTTGEVDLTFDAQFQFTAGAIYRASPLHVATTLTTEDSSGPIRRGHGTRLNADGKARLVGVARVPKTGDGFLDGFLMLPTDALAVLSAELKFLQ